MNDLARAAMLDQAAAATRDALDLETVLSGGRGFRRQVEPGPHMAVCIHLMMGIAESDQLRPCAHIVERTAQPAFWFSWSPTGFLCAECALTACQVHENPAEGSECARCRAVVPAETFTVNGWMRPAMFDNADDPPIVTPPLLLRVGLCAACQRVEDGAA